MHPTHFARLWLTAVPLADVHREYAAWILGEGRHRRRRRSRLEVGVDEQWTVDALAGDATLVGRHDCRVETRSTADAFVLRFVHGDQQVATRRWHTVVRARVVGDEVEIEHASGQTVGGGDVPLRVAAPPAVLRDLVEQHAAYARPRELYTAAAIGVRGDEAERFVGEILLAEGRALPYVLVSPESATGVPLVDPDELARSLVSLAVVVDLDGDATFALRRAFEREGFPGRVGQCFDGAIKMFNGPIAQHDDPRQHYLWLPARLRDLGRSMRECSARVAGEVASRIAARRVPAGFFGMIDDFDEGARALRATEPTR